MGLCFKVTTNHYFYRDTITRWMPTKDKQRFTCLEFFLKEKKKKGKSMHKAFVSGKWYFKHQIQITHGFWVFCGLRVFSCFTKCSMGVSDNADV